MKKTLKQINVLCITLLGLFVLILSWCNQEYKLQNNVTEKTSVNNETELNEEVTDVVKENIKLIQVQNESNVKQVSEPNNMTEKTINNEKDLYKQEEIDNLNGEQKEDEQDIVKNKIITCKKLSEFKNENRINQFIVQPIYEIEDRDACIIDDYFIFIPQGNEFGCTKILRYNIKTNILDESIFWSDKNLCANRFGEVTDSYIEYFGIMWDGLYNTEYHGKYFYLTNIQELIEKKNVKIE